MARRFLLRQDCPHSSPTLPLVEDEDIEVGALADPRVPAIHIRPFCFLQQTYMASLPTSPVGLFLPECNNSNQRNVCYTGCLSYEVIFAVTYLPRFSPALDIFPGETHVADEKHSDGHQRP